MYVAWTKNLKDPEEKSAFERSVLGSRPVLDRLKQILIEEGNALDRSELDVRTYDLPNWDYRQADKNGFRRCLGIITKLVDLDQQKEEIK